MFYKQKFDLPIGSLFNAVLTCIYLEFLESGPFKYIISSNPSYFTYIDDISFIYPQDFDINRITKRLNNVEPSIKFLYELESNNTLPFLNVFYL